MIMNLYSAKTIEEYSKALYTLVVSLNNIILSFFVSGPGKGDWAQNLMFLYDD